MNNLQIDRILSSIPRTRKNFMGVYNIKFLPIRFFRKNVLVVVNTEENIEKIGHWVAFYIESNKIIFFDSFAKHPVLHYGGNIGRLFLNYTQRVIALKKPVQHPLSSVCGAYVIWFLHNITTCKNIPKLFKIFKYNDKIRNDNYVKNYLLRLNKCIKIY